MTTARDIIKTALRKIHVLGKGSSLDPDEANDALGTLNALLSSWSAEGSLVYTETKETFLLTNAVSYTIGSGGDFDTVRPNSIMNAYTTQGSIDYPITAIDSNQYSAIGLKATGSSYPRYYYYDAAYPVATLYLYPKPSGGTITMTTFKPLTQFTTLDTVFNMPLEYKAALEFNLATWLAMEYEREPAPTLKKLAVSTKNVVKAQNRRNEFYTSEIDVPSRDEVSGDIYGGYF